jgi:ABC-type multidrug transport system ATPase subunit
MRRLMTGRTTLVISPNLLIVTDADQILYLDHGRITGAGTHHELLATHPGYEVIEHIRRGEDLDSYEAWSAQRHCRCFIKTLRPDCATDRCAHRHLLREARLLLSLTHPHLRPRLQCG